MFSGCSSLSSIDLSSFNAENVTSISGLFSRCNNLNRIDSPKNLNEKIDLPHEFHFDDNKDGKFDGIDTYITIFPSSESHRYISKEYDPSEYDDVTPRDSETSTILAGKLGIKVIDSDNKPVEGVSVGYDGITPTGLDSAITPMALNGSGQVLSGLTDNNGKVDLDIVEGYSAINATKDGYIPILTNWDNAVSGNGSDYLEINLFKEDEGLKLKYAKYRVITDTFRKTYDLRYEDCKFNKNSKEKFTINCKAANESIVKEYRLVQGKENPKEIATSTDGTFADLLPSDFETGGEVSVVIVGNDENANSFPLMLEFYTFADSSMELDFKKGKFTFDIDDSVPLLGKNKISLGLPKGLPVNFKYSGAGENEKLIATINLGENVWKDESTLKRNTEILKKGKIKEVKEFYKNVVDKHTYALTGNSVKVSFFGYIEFPLGDNVKGNGKLYMIIEQKASYTWDAAVYFIPVTAEFSEEFKIEHGDLLDYTLNNDGLQVTNINTYLNPSLTLKVTGGIGNSAFKEYAYAGAYGKGTGSAKIKNYVELEEFKLEGSIGFEWKFLKAEGEYEGLKGEWKIYPKENSLNSPLPLNSTNSDSLTPIDFSTLSSQSSWISSPIAEDNVLYTLLDNSYKYSAPVFAQNGDNAYIAFLNADTSGNIFTQVSRYNGTSFTSPVTLSTGTDILDDAPSICVTDDGKVYVAYTRATDEYENDMTSLYDMARTREIVVQRLDPTTLSVISEKVYDTGKFIYSPSIAATESNVVFTYSASEVTDDDSVLNPESTDVYIAEISGDSYGAASKILSETNIGIAKAGSYNGEAAVAYAKYPDESTKQICVSTASGSSVLSSNTNGSVSYLKLPGTNSYQFVWNEDSNLKAADGSAINCPGISNNYSASENGIYYITAGSTDGYSTELWRSDYDGTSYNSPVRVLSDQIYFENFGAMTLSGEDYVIGLNTIADFSGTSMETTKDLVWARISENVSDITLSSVDLDNSIISGNVPVTMDITNAGNHTVTSVDIKLDGNLLKTESVSIAPGATSSVTVDITSPGQVETHELSIIETGCTEDPQSILDNTESITFCEADVSVSAHMELNGDQKGVIIRARNEGGVPASGTLKLLDVTGNEYYSENISNLENGSLFISQRWIPVEDNEKFAGCSKIVFVPTSSDRYEYNNKDIVNTLVYGEALNENSGSGQNPDQDTPSGGNDSGNDGSENNNSGNNNTGTNNSGSNNPDNTTRENTSSNDNAQDNHSSENISDTDNSAAEKDPYAPTFKQSKSELSATKLKKKSQKITIKVGNSKGKITFRNKTSKNLRKYVTAKVKGRKVVITLKKGAKKGTYKIKINVAKKGKYKKATKTITIKVK
ncbi:hypothetical protein [Butyrivibrio sp. WCD3002]|uniref:hypothetical protein n=1 Tax=Butyrivibrio sp. WCD3002 TaxID=1280676 RepID=UPI000425090E|nr:hypothetical protein [Butyrivibrio sp. WCD3002]